MEDSDNSLLQDWVGEGYRVAIVERDPLRMVMRAGIPCNVNEVVIEGKLWFADHFRCILWPTGRWADERATWTRLLTGLRHQGYMVTQQNKREAEREHQAA